ncbi:WD repeat-containing protein 54 [Acipenser ruthenus]|uniref:WD repeat-containing protein 54 n=1 Tax=Acipenser ruthenus TaxID=7906 RepID=A0A444UY23_ACIRT|nr:WD repeat-containing protein 54 [Acipenser ruthenus]
MAPNYRSKGQAVENQEYIADIVSADDSGLLCIWKAGKDFKLLKKIPAYGCSCSSVKLWCGIVIAGYGSGQIRLYDALSGVVHAEVNAHARWIYALDIAPDSGKLLSGAEDSLVRIWKLSKSPESHTVEVTFCCISCETLLLLLHWLHQTCGGTAHTIKGLG